MGNKINNKQMIIENFRFLLLKNFWLQPGIKPKRINIYRFYSILFLFPSFINIPVMF